MLYMRNTTSSVDQVCKLIEQAASENKFGVLGEHDLKKKMIEKGLQFDYECRIIEVCNPQQAKNILMSEMALSTALPCRISVYEEEGKVKVATIKPTAIIEQFHRSDLRAVAQEVEETLIRIIDAACKE